MTSGEGVLYVLDHETFQHYGNNVYKLGMTNNPERRLQGYSPGFLSTAKFLYVSQQFASCHEAEKVMFYVLRGERMKQQREFFQLPKELAICVIQNLEKLSGDEVHELYIKARNKVLPQGVIARLRGDAVDYEEKWSTKYTKGVPADVFLEQFKYVKKHP